MGTMKLSYLHLLSDRDHLLSLAGDYTDALRRKEEEVDRLSRELEDTQASLVNTPLALQDLEKHGGEHGVELSLVSSCTSNTQLSAIGGSYVVVDNVVSSSCIHIQDTPLDSASEEDCRRQPSQHHHVSSQLRVSERDIAIACQHFNVARQLLAVYGMGSPTSDEQGDSYISLMEIHSLWEAI